VERAPRPPVAVGVACVVADAFVRPILTLLLVLLCSHCFK